MERSALWTLRDLYAEHDKIQAEYSAMTTAEQEWAESQQKTIMETIFDMVRCYVEKELSQCDTRREE